MEVNVRRLTGLLLLAAAAACAAGDKPEVRKAAVAGAFYPADAKELASSIDQMLAQAPAVKVDGDIVAVVAPHAGYV